MVTLLRFFLASRLTIVSLDIVSREANKKQLSKLLHVVGLADITINSLAMILSVMITDIEEFFQYRNIALLYRLLN